MGYDLLDLFEANKLLARAAMAKPDGAGPEDQMVVGTMTGAWSGDDVEPQGEKQYVTSPHCKKL